MRCALPLAKRSRRGGRCSFCHKLTLLACANKSGLSHTIYNEGRDRQLALADKSALIRTRQGGSKRPRSSDTNHQLKIS